jgi:beta-lactamase superfamily II metal-dependent hydrolase
MFLAENDPRRATGLIWLDEAVAQKPATHALIIGVGAYQSPKFKQPLTSTTVSARAVADFFVDPGKASFHNPAVPLGSVALLLSEPENGGSYQAHYGNGLVLRATFANASAAVGGWADRMDSSPDNFAFLYVASHGESSQGKTAFLLEDCFLDHNRATYGMVEVEQLGGALENTTPTKQLLLFDCCRIPSEMKLPWGEQFGDKLISRVRDENDHGQARLQKAISATLPDEVSLGRVNNTTLFADALLTALDGVASDTSFRNLPVRAGNLSDKINDLLALHRRPDEEKQVTDVDGAGTFDITVPVPRPTVPVFLSLADPANWPQSVMTVTPSVGNSLTLYGIDGAPPFHRIDLQRRIDVAVRAENGGKVLGSTQAEVGAPALFLRIPDDSDVASRVVGQLPRGLRSILPSAQIEIYVKSQFSVDAGAVATILRSDEPDKNPKQISVKLGNITPVEVRPGGYNIVVWMPDRKIFTRTVQVDENQILRVSFESEASPHEWLAGAAATGVIRRSPPPSAESQRGDLTVAAAASLEFSIIGHVGIDLAVNFRTQPQMKLDCSQDDGRLARIDVVDEINKRFILEDAGPITRPFFAQIVSGTRRELAAIPAVGLTARNVAGGWNPYLVIDRAAPDRASLTKVVAEDTRWIGLLGFLGARSFDLADKLLDTELKEKFHTALMGDQKPTVDAMDAIEAKVRNPVAAAAGALVAVAASRDDMKERWDAWLYNLANWFPNLADGPIILGRRLLMRARSANQIAVARDWFFKGFDRGVPVYSLSVDWLARGLESLPGEDAELQRRRLVARSLANRVDTSQAFTVVRLSNSVPPRLSLKSGFRLAMQPASDGDAIILKWGDDTAPHQLLIDLGRTDDYRALKPQLTEIGKFDLFTVTHIDADHIEGAVPLFKDTPPPFEAKHVWFNAHAQLEAANARLPVHDREILSAGQGEKVTKGIVKTGWPWNDQFASGVVSVDSPEAAGPIVFDGGLSLTLLSPSDRKLSQLLPTWNAELQQAGLRTTDTGEVARVLAKDRELLGSLNIDFLAGQPFKPDTTKANGASIAFIAEVGGKRVLFAADAHPDILVASLQALGASEANPYRLDCLKVSHHGSKANTSPQLLKIIDCTRFAFSTDGSRHGHPDPETIARILKNDPDRHKTLMFNFRQPRAEIWDDAELKRRWHYECLFPAARTVGIEFEI